MSAPRKRTLWLMVTLVALVALWAVVRHWRSSRPEQSAVSTLDPLKLREPTLTADASVETLRSVASQVADEVAAEFPTDVGALDVQAQVQYSLGQHAAARAGWEKCVALDPQNAAQYRATLGFAAITRGDYQEAAKALREARDAGSQDPRVLVQLADSLMELGQVDEAVALLEDGIRRQALPAAAMTTLGQGHLQLGRCEQAMTAFKVVLDLDPKDKAACYGAVMASMRLGQQEQAANYMQQFPRARERRARGSGRGAADVRRSGFGS